MISTFDLVTCALRLFCCLKYSEHPQLTCKAAPGRYIMIHLDINGIDVLHQLALPRDVLNKQNHLKYLESPENFWTKPSGTFENISVNYLHGQHFYDLGWPTGGKYRYNFPEYLNHFWNRLWPLPCMLPAASLLNPGPGRPALCPWQSESCHNDWSFVRWKMNENDLFNMYIKKHMILIP